ncbi:CHAT domain-containing tetratricopeptide repeat protein [Trichocoleus sp. AS-A1]
MTKQFIYPAVKAIPSQRIIRIAFITLLSSVSTPLLVNFPFPLSAPRALAQTQDDRTEADQLFQQGVQQFQTSQFEAALQSWQQALMIYREIKDRPSEGQVLVNLGVAYFSLGLYGKAIDCYEQVLAIVKENEDRSIESYALGNLGNAYHSLGDFARAIEYHQQHLTLAKSIQDRSGEGKALGNLGNAYNALGDFPRAIEYHQQYLALARAIQDRSGEGKALGNLGVSYRNLGDFPRAIEYNQQYLVIAKEMKDRQAEGNALRNLGLAYNSLGDFARAIEYQQQNLAIAKAIKDRSGEGKALGSLGVIYRNLGDFPQAIEYHQQNLAIAREIQDRYGEGNALGNLGVAYSALGDYSKAIDYFQQVLAIARAIQNRSSESHALGNLGLAYNSLGGFQRAIDYYQQTLAIAKQIKDRQSEGKVLGNLGGTYYSLRDFPRAIEYQRQFLAIAKAIKDRSGEGQALGNLGLALYKAGNLKAAEKTLIDAIEVRESLRRELNDANKVSIFEMQSNSYRTLQQVFIAQNKTDAALEVAERGRARAFVELLASRLQIDKLQAEGSNQPSKLQSPTIERIKQIAASQNATLVQYSIIYDAFKVQGKEQTKESELYIWVINPTGEVTFRKVDLKPLWQQQNTSLANLVFSSRQSMGVRGRGGGVVAELIEEEKPTRRLQQIHKLLIEPIGDRLPSDPKARVIFIPQHELFLTPFPALQDASGKYLIEKHTILTAPSIQVLDLTHQQRQRVETQSIPSLQEALVVGNPIMPGVVLNPGEPAQQLPNLPWAEQEAKDIAKLLKTQAITGSQATKVAIAQALPKARIIHLATHGLLDDYRGLGSAIALAPSNQNDGLLTAEEILNLKLNAELVVLSACDTGRGRITGDGVIGLSRSLISAGVPSVVVSLWQVPDNSTAFLMTEFYKNLQQKADKATALRNAMLTTMKQQQYSDPVQWAAFTLIGEAE